ncbi:MAG: ABC transporter ATP-binding protein [Anaerolinea sp.]|nr:ABC transporter ATP-binding protein [Anaerolinea sp.]
MMSSSHQGIRSESVAVIETDGLSKAYRRGTFALKRLTLSVQSGEIFGYLGPNGAGKTTTIRLLLDLIRPSAGSARIFGLDVRAEAIAVHRRIGYLPGELSLWDGLTGWQTIRYFARLRGLTDLREVDILAERLQFDPGKKVRTYSTGNKRKLGLILALMGKPDLLILDEPTTGLDPLIQQTFYDLMCEARAEGRTVFLSSHILSEVQTICDRVGILRRGELKAVQRIDELTKASFRHVDIQFADAVDLAQLHLEHVRGLERDPAAPDHRLRFQWHGPIDRLLRALTAADVTVADLRIQEPTLEDIFLTFYQDEPGVSNGRSGNRHMPEAQAAGNAQKGAH